MFNFKRKRGNYTKKLFDAAASAVFGGSVYLVGEMLFRQLTYRPALHSLSGLMFLMGAVSFSGAELLFSVLSNKSKLTAALAGGLWITSTEAVFGIFLLDILDIRTWDYTLQPFNYRGVICLKWSLLWCVLSYIAVIIRNRWDQFRFIDRHKKDIF